MEVALTIYHVLYVIFSGVECMCVMLGIWSKKYFLKYFLYIFCCFYIEDINLCDFKNPRAYEILFSNSVIQRLLSNLLPYQ